MKKVLTTLLCVLVLIAILPGSVAAAQIAPVVVVPETEIAVDQTTGAFRFTMELMTEKSYAGAEFGLICSQGVQITAVSAADGTVTGPQAANGLIWFGYFAGEDSFSDTNTLTIEGTCEIGREGAVIIQDASVYTIGDQEYSTVDLESGMLVNLRTTPVKASKSENPELAALEFDIDVLILIGCLLVIAAGLIGTLIYKKNKKPMNHQKENQNASE